MAAGNTSNTAFSLVLFDTTVPKPFPEFWQFVDLFDMKRAAFISPLQHNRQHMTYAGSINPEDERPYRRDPTFHHSGSALNRVCSRLDFLPPASAPSSYL